jgi:hypothetical protein
MVTNRLLALSGTAFLLGCSGGGESHAPAPSQSVPSLAAAQPGDTAAKAPWLRSATQGEGVLELVAATDVTSYLGSLHAVVENADGRVVGGADEEIATPASAAARGLSLVLPAGDDYTVSLTAATADAQPTTCRALVAGLRVEAGATARAQIFSWNCGDVTGYVPSARDGDCLWLADWSFVTRTSAALGDLITVAAAGHDLGGRVPAFRWSTASDRGSFENPTVARTSFRCQVADEKLALTVALSAAGCEQRVTQTVSCL